MWPEGRFLLDRKSFPYIDETFKSVGIFLVTRLSEQIFHFSREKRQGITRTNVGMEQRVAFFPPDEDAKLLLVQQGDVEGNPWNVVAGKRDGKETFLETAVRETLEETGLIYRPEQFNFLAACERRIYLSALLPYGFNPASLLPRNEITGFQLVNVENFYAGRYDVGLYRQDILLEHKYLLRDVFSMFGIS